MPIRTCIVFLDRVQIHIFMQCARQNPYEFFLHEYVNFVHGPEKPYSSLSTKIYIFMQCAPKSFGRFSSLRADAEIGRISSDFCTSLSTAKYGRCDRGDTLSAEKWAVKDAHPPARTSEPMPAVNAAVSAWYVRDEIGLNSRKTSATSSDKFGYTRLHVTAPPLLNSSPSTAGRTVHPA